LLQLLWTSEPYIKMLSSDHGSDPSRHRHLITSLLYHFEGTFIPPNMRYLTIFALFTATAMASPAPDAVISTDMITEHEPLKAPACLKQGDAGSTWGSNRCSTSWAKNCWDQCRSANMLCCTQLNSQIVNGNCDWIFQKVCACWCT